MIHSSAKRFKGFTLAEVIVSLALVSLLLVSLAQLLNSCWKYLRQTTLTTELQQSCVMATSRLVTELLEGNAISIRGDSVNHQYCSFGSARGPEGEFTFTPTGDLQWHRIVGYYVELEGQDFVLYRKTKPLDSVGISPPIIKNIYHAGFWRSYAGPRAMVAKRIYFLDVVSTTTVDVILGAKSYDDQFVVNIRTKLKTRN